MKTDPTPKTPEEAINTMLAQGITLEGVILYYGNVCGSPGYEYLDVTYAAALAREDNFAPGY